VAVTKKSRPELIVFVIEKESLKSETGNEHVRGETSLKRTAPMSRGIHLPRRRRTIIVASTKTTTKNERKGNKTLEGGRSSLRQGRQGKNSITAVKGLRPGGDDSFKGETGVNATSTKTKKRSTRRGLVKRSSQCHRSRLMTQSLLPGRGQKEPGFDAKTGQGEGKKTLTRSYRKIRWGPLLGKNELQPRRALLRRGRAIIA